MKLFKILLIALISCSIIIFSAAPGLNQSGTQSDVTVPNPIEINPQPRNDLPRSQSNNRVDRSGFEKLVISGSSAQAVQGFEELQAVEISNHFGFDLFGRTASVDQISDTLCQLSETTGKKAALIYVISLADRLDLLLVLPKDEPCNTPQSKQNNNRIIIRKLVPEAKGSLVQQVAREFRIGVTDLNNPDDYKAPAQQLYQWIVTPLRSELLANQIDTLLFSMDTGLRSIPIAAFFDGKQFLIEQYSVALIPSFSLTDTRYVPITNSQILAMGISKSTQEQTPLPAVAVEIPTLTNKLWRGVEFLNESATLDNLKSTSRKQRFEIIHVATHAEFRPGNISESYIQFWDNKLRLNQLRDLSKNVGWELPPKVEMLVLSACRTALGSEEAELGFAGLAIQAGVKTAIGSLWYASDEGSLALMTEFYLQLRTAPIKTEALKQAQLALLKEQVRVESGKLRLSDNRLIPLPPEIAARGDQILSHPYFWSAYTLVGNWN
ncbi:MAG TPA: CHAT domain-containing protein [Cyanobacteria bacterium UBA11369]|nr:CHAT domain-containing protein [Cyanobacteria bacterium UBA11371]HBE48563.1 CHAT domain-containing protein [Cyanobacteria bacterium UBA11369]